MSCGQKTAPPIQRACPRSAWTRLQHDKTRQVLRFTANAVSHPGAHAGPAKTRRACVEENLCRSMIEVVCVDRRDEGQVVDHPPQMRKTFRNVSARLAVALELPPRAQQLGNLPRKAVHEGKALAFQKRFWNRFAAQLHQLWLVFKQIQLARTASHKQVNDTLGF